MFLNIFTEEDSRSRSAVSGGGNKSGKAFSDLTVSAILDERKMQAIAETAIQAAMLQLRDRFIINFIDFHGFCHL